MKFPLSYTVHGVTRVTLIMDTAQERQFAKKIETVAAKQHLSFCAGVVEGEEGLPAALTASLPPKIQSQPLAELAEAAHAIDTLLHLAHAAIPTFHRIGGRGQQAVVQEGKRFLQVG